MRSFLVSLMVALCLFGQAKADDPPLGSVERRATVHLTRIRAVRLWWNPKNRVVGAAFKGVNATNRSVELASQLPLLRILVLTPVVDNALTDEGLASIAKLDNLELLCISGADVTDQGVAHLSGLRKLRTLAINGRVSDAALEPISQMQTLELLDLSHAHVTDAGMASIAKLKNVQYLVLNGTNITSQGLAPISQMKSLLGLCLSNTAIDDSAVEYLKQLSTLDELTILGTRMTVQGVRSLQPAFDTGCEIIHDSRTYRGERSEAPGFAYTAAR